MSKTAPYPVPSGVVLIVTKGLSHVAAWLQEVCMTYGWPHVLLSDHERLAWTATVHRPQAVLLVSDSETWTSQAAAAVRGTSKCALVVVGSHSTPSRVALIRSGVDTIISPKTPGEELLARIFAIIRRVEEVLEPGTRYLVADELRVDMWKRAATLSGNEVPLTPTEFSLLAHLMGTAGQSVSKHTLISRVWNAGGIDGVNTLRLTVGRLRKKLGETASAPRFIKSVRGHGYRFDAGVLELADEHRTRAAPDSHSEVLRAAEELGQAISGGLTEETVAESFVAQLVQSNTVDAAAVHHLDNDALHLQAHIGMSKDWVDTVEHHPIPLKPGYASADALLSETPLLLMQLPPKLYRETKRVTSGDPPSSYLFLPARISGTYEALVGVVRRRAEPYNPLLMSYLRTAVAIYGSIITARRAALAEQQPFSSRL